MINEFYRDREQMQVKHRILQRYLQAFTPIIGRSFEEIVYVDCLAGPWKSRDENLSDTSFDNAISVFREFKRLGVCKRVRVLMIENDPSTYQLLEEYGRSISDIEVETRQWDFNEHIEDIVRFAKRSPKSFAFFFIDPTGWKEICIQRIAPLLRVAPGEVLINFMSSWIKRFLEDETKPFAELLGREVARLRCLDGEELEDALIDVYSAEMRRVGAFEYVRELPILMPDKDEIHYHLVFGTRGYKGLEEFIRVEKAMIPFMHEVRALAQRRREQERSGQTFLLAPDEMYQETRLTRYCDRRRVSARTAIRAILSTNRTVEFDVLLHECAQFATVGRSDLQSWLDEWKAKGLLQFDGMSPRQRVPNSATLIRVLGIL